MKIKSNSWQFILTFVPSLLILSATLFGKIVFNLHISLLMRDPAAIAGQSPLIGIISNIGGITWFASATVCIFSAVILYGYTSKNIFVFSVVSGLLSIYLFVDDFFMFHEYLAPKYLGIAQTYILFSIVIFVLAYIAKFYKLILSMDYKFLLLSLLFLATSIFSDVLPKSLFVGHEDLQLLLEDGSKFLGIVSWFSYFFGIHYQLILNKLAS